MKGAIINHYASEGKDFGRALAGEHFQPETSTATFSVLKVEWVYCMVVMKWKKILIFNFRISIWRFPCQNQCCHATRTDPAVLIMILTRRWTSTALWSDKSDKSHWHCYRWNISSPTSTTSNILLLIGWSSVRKLEIWQPRVNWSSERELSELHF